jgi:guanylate kinase
MMSNPHQLLGNLQRGILFILSAPAGTGKTTLIHRLKDEFSCVVQSISSTTRSPRSNERDGVDYLFLTRDAFEEKAKEGEFLEYVELYGHYYGTSKVWVENQLNQGKHVFLVIDTQGALQLQQKEAEHALLQRVVYIFVEPPSMETLRLRLEGRGTETAAVMEQRLNEAEREMEAASHYDYLIVNDDLETAYQTLKCIVVAEEHKIGQR